MTRIAVALAALMLVAVACGDDEAITVEGEWARQGTRVVTNGAVYMDLTAAEDDALIGASVDPSIAAAVEVHEVTMNADGAMMMSEIPKLELPAGETVTLKPGGYHVMLIDTAQTLELGLKFDVTLVFEKAGERTIEVEVFEEAP
jgi:copper(I)-binding protein